MAFFKHLKVLAPLLAAVIVVACAGVSLSGYTLPVYEVEVEAATVEEEEQEEEEESPIGQGDWDLEDGVYRGTGVGYSGNVVVDVTIENRTITAIEIVSYVDDEAYFRLALSVIDSILETQTLDVDVVSGATYSSNGIINAVRNALTGEEDDSETAETDPAGTTEIEDVEDASAYNDGTYYGTGTGFGGTLKVKVVIAGGIITSIEVVSNNDDAAYFNRAVALLDTIIETQSTNVDTVSGATYSSVGLITAVRNALAQAAVDGDTTETTETTETEDTAASDSVSAADVEIAAEGNFPYPDGTYTGTAEGWGGEITVSITLSNGTLTGIEVLSHEDETASYYNRATAVITSIIAAQSTDVDVVSGATYSSNGIIGAVEAALAKAEAAANVDTQDSGSDAQTEAQTDTETETGSDAAEGSEDTQEADEGELYNNGSYTGTARCVDTEDGEFDYILGLTVTIENDTITAITDVTEDGVVYTEGTENKTYIKRAVEGRSFYTGVVEQILSLGILDDLSVLNLDTETISDDSNTINAVSGATYSSESIYNAVWDALEQAKKSGTENSSETDAQADSADGEDGAGSADSGDTETGADAAGSDDTESSAGSGDAETDTDAAGSDDTETGAGSTDSGDTETDAGGSAADSDSADASDETGSEAESSTGGVLYSNGTYTGSASCVDTEDGEFDYVLGVTITIENDVITSISNVTEDGVEYTEGTENKTYIKRAVEGRSSYTGVAAQILSLGLIDSTTVLNLDTDNLSSASNTINAVSGATYSSESLFNAVLNALEKAKI